MARAIWSGSIAFGLVSVPVKLFTAVAHKEVRFHLLHDRDGGRIREKRVCAADGREVPYEHVVKGYEVARGRYVRIAPEELAALDPKATRTIDIEDFVSLGEIDPIYYERTYYLAPDRGGAKAYALLVATLRKTNKVAIARIVLRTRQSLCAVRPIGGALALSTMSWADEVLPSSELEGLRASDGKPTKKELAMAEQLVGSLVTPFRPEKYHDEYRERVLELIERKKEGEEIVAPVEKPVAARAIDLMEALKQSLAHERRPRRARRRYRPDSRKRRVRPSSSARVA
jgi:DNA end-binding protein Ku